MFLSNVNSGISTFLFYKRNVREKKTFFKISTSSDFLLGCCTDIIILRHLSVLSEICSFAALFNIRQN